MRIPLLSLSLLALAALQACAAGETYVDVQQTFPAPKAAEERLCTDPRPEICTREYLPVCARLEDGRQKTYSNGCTACSDPAVTGYQPGECPQ